MSKQSRIEKLLKPLFCDKGNHWYRDDINPENSYHVCRICKHKYEFTRTEYWALSRGLPPRRTIAYDVGKFFEGLAVNTAAWVIILTSFIFSIAGCLAPILIIIWLLRHW